LTDEQTAAARQQAVNPESREVAVAAARAASDKQAGDIVVLDVREPIVITDYFVIASAASDRQVKTVAEEVEHALKELGARPVRREGDAESRWMLLDYFDVIVHVMRADMRDRYDLETLWGDAPRVKTRKRLAKKA
jgi:ribosome-associated protein